MNRRQKIIVSITGIFLVLLILVGLTYGYFLTRIQGNTNSKSISTSTADLKLVYGDGNGILSPTTKLVPNTTVGTKTFTVTNEGDSKVDDYVVVFENVQNDLDRPEDLVYTVTCTSDKPSNTCNGVEDAKSFPKGDGTENKVNGIIVVNSIDEGEIQTYELTLKYLEPGVDQSSDMNKTIEGKINIRDAQTINPYNNQKDTLAYSIINNAMNLTDEERKKGYAEFRAIPLTVPGKDSTSIFYDGEPGEEKGYTGVSNKYYTYGDSYKLNKYTGLYEIINKDGSDLKAVLYSTDYETLKGKYIIDNYGSSSATPRSYSYSTVYQISDNSTKTELKYREIKSSISENSSAESTLSMADDDYGISYYYRGGVKNNYINFGGFCWRIMRIEGDGSIEIVLEDKNGECKEYSSPEEGGVPVIGQALYGDYNDDLSERYDLGADDSGSMKNVFEGWLTTNLTSVTSKLKDKQICIGDTSAYKEDGTKMTEAEKQEAIEKFQNIHYKKYIDFGNGIISYKCGADASKTKETKIYPLTVDEIAYAGGNSRSDNYTYYLNDSGWRGKVLTMDFSVSTGTDWFEYMLADNGSIYSSYAGYEYVRPAVSIIAGTKLSSGTGDISDPYEIQ